MTSNTDIQQGRLRTLAERLESWKRGDRARGWVHRVSAARIPPIQQTPCG
ncbi:hypothetical protein ONR57_12495 [Hoyosella sp. YIM 151337]|nr:hypothetical protein [Hoyosella sp. YIM 151337]MCW4354119.1 hypothetical protein [Hoyosella sp. YIM 151337]